MPRNLDSGVLAALQSGFIQPIIMAKLTFKSMTSYVWSGVGPLIYSGNTFQGVGNLAGIGPINEGIDVHAQGTVVYLSGIDPALYEESVADIQIGAPATIWFGVMSQGVIVGTPFVLFDGQIDKPSVVTGTDSITISLALENLMTNLQRASNKRYTSADQRILYPTDSAFHFVETLSDLALRWGS